MAGATQSHADARREEAGRFLTGVGRGIAGALLFALPMFMTMEMWALGFYMGRAQLFLLLVLNIPLLILLAHRIGFEETFSWREACRDAAIAYGMGIVASALILCAVGILKAGMPASEIIGKIAVQSVPASIGAMLGRSQLGGTNDGGDNEDDEDDSKQSEIETGYSGELFMMAVGALFLSLNVAPTEEMILLSYKMTPWHALAVIVFSICVMHGFVYAVSFKGSHEILPETPWWHAFVRFTLPGYIIAVLISLYALWTFEQLGDSSPTQILMSVIVLSFPGAIGAAAARLIL
ncbi:TIGR02587 family membrane protein [Pararhizobium sp.]|uniref:TIGR02587 family membrane protein n=1 Tax=Pararhizobium sp. TaxID=1977563 RepID=UPI002726B30F|nr:TIGR02587 family membrane protein [Pararhizobium sp.]MDO9418440.1 TIGR02587 family membrane protein [Pararhizobium sp.]